VAKALGLQNVQAKHARAEDIDQDFEFVVSRAVTRITPFYYWVRKKSAQIISIQCEMESCI